MQLLKPIDPKLLTGALVLLLASFLAGYYLSPKRTDERLAEVKQFFERSEPRDLLSGRIESIDGDALRIRTLKRTPLEEPTERTARVTDATRYTRLEEKTSEERKAELRDFKAKVASATSFEGLFAPPLLIRRPISFADLKPGDYVEVDTAEPVQDQPEFTAEQIHILIGRPSHEYFE